MSTKIMAVSLLALMVGCTLPSASDKATGAGADGASPGAEGDAGAPGSKPAAAAGPSSCLAILQCVAACADEACANACVDKSPKDAQTPFVALVQCMDTQKCSDTACVQTSCKTELDACTAESKPTSGGTPLTGDAPPGSIPAEVVGVWSYTAWGGTDRFTFNADGTAMYEDGTNGTAGGCVVTELATYNGSAVFAGPQFTLYAPTASYMEFKCGQKTTTPEPAVTMVFDYTYAAAKDVIHVTEQQSSRCNYPDATNRQFYCGHDLTRTK